MNKRKTLPIIFSILIFILTTTASFAQKENQQNPCYQDKDEKLKFIEKAESNQYNVKHIEIVGNTYTRYKTFRKHFALNEGDIFTRDALEKTVDGFNKITAIYPISLENVKVWLDERAIGDRKWNIINLTFCVKQKDKK